MKTQLSTAIKQADLILFQGLIATIIEEDGVVQVHAHGTDGLSYEAKFLDQICELSTDGVLPCIDIDGDATELVLFIRMPDYGR